MMRVLYSLVLIGTNDSFQSNFSSRLALPLLELTYAIPFDKWWGNDAPKGECRDDNAHVVSVDTSMRRLQRLLEVVLDGRSIHSPPSACIYSFLSPSN